MTFEQAVKIILEKEGGYVNHKNDPGGATKYGITKKFYPHLDIPNLTIEQAAEIYHKEYWAKIQADAMPSYLRLIAFDCAVNQGVGFCLDSLRNIAGERAGTPMNVVYKKLSTADKTAVETAFFKRRMDRYTINKNFKVFGKGWTNRLFEIAKISGFDVGNA